jgi:hypothetical protein
MVIGRYLTENSKTGKNTEGSKKHKRLIINEIVKRFFIKKRSKY